MSSQKAAVDRNPVACDDVATIAGIQAMPTILDVVCRTTGMALAAVARITDGRWILCGVRDEAGYGLRPGFEMPLEDTICREVGLNQTIVIGNVADDPQYRDHPVPARIGFQSYISVPVVLPDGSPFGRLCAIDPRPARLDLAEIRATCELFAQLIGFHIDAHRRLAGTAQLHIDQASLQQRVAERTAERDLFASIVQSTDMLVMACDLGLRIIAVNAAMGAEMERRYGVRPAIGDHLLDLLGDRPQQRRDLAASWTQGLAGHESTRIEAVAEPGRDQRYFQVTFRALHDDSGERIGCYQFATDVTERMREQTTLAEAQEALRQSQKMEAVGQLTGGLAHDFNNLVTGISGSLELLQTRIRQGRLTEIDRYVSAAQAAAQRAAALTHRLLAFSRRQTLDPQPTDVARLVAGLQEMISRTVGPEIGIEVTSEDGQWPVLADASQLETAVLNLCINARDAMPAGGTLLVVTSNRRLSETEAAEFGLAAGDYVVLCVADNGTGMSPEVAARAFDPFFTTKPSGMGTGLGLSMIDGFARQSAGQVRISSAVGQGTAVSLYLPRHRGAAPLPDEVASPVDLPRATAGETVLIVDDDPTIRMLLRDVLLDRGYLVREAPDGARGLRELQADARVDLLVTDVGLPGGINGRQLADAARRARPALKVLFITGYAENAVLDHDQLAPGMHVLTKPFSMEALAGKVGELIRA